MAEMFLYFVTSLLNLFIELQTLLTSRRVSCKSKISNWYVLKGHASKKTLSKVS